MAIKKNELYPSLWASCDELCGGGVKLFQLLEMLSQRFLGQAGVELPALKLCPLQLLVIKERAAVANVLFDMDKDSKHCAKTRQIMIQELLTGRVRFV